MAEPILKRVARWFERRFTLRDPEAKEVFGVQPVRAGVVVTPATAVQFAAVYNAVRILSESVASLPLHVYRRRADGGRERADDYPLYRVLHDQPNPLMTSFQWREAAMWHLLLWGNTYAEIVRQDGFVTALWPIPPWLVQPELDETLRDIVYRINLPQGGQVVLRKEQVLHVAGPGWDGLVGKSVIALARESIGLGMAAEQFGASFFGNGAHMAGVLEHPGNLTEEAAERLRKQWRELYSGLSNAHRIAVLEEGMKYQRIGIPPEDAQFLQTREFQVEEVSRWFNLPPHMLKDLRRSTFSNIEHQALEFVKYSLLPWLRRFEQAIKARLLAGEDEQDLYAEFSIEGLLRGDIESRYRAYAVARQWGWFSANDVRRMENMDPIEGGDVYLVPMNMVPATAVGQVSGEDVRQALLDLMLAQARSDGRGGEAGTAPGDPSALDANE
ncbi:MAG: phage portal protein [Bacillota bacterium]|nr:MAG: phage portal protein [Bacillota bacterium]